MSDPIPLGEEGDRPIIVQGGGSVNVFVPPTFSEQVDISYQQVAGEPKDKDFKNANANLVSLQIDDNEPIKLNRNSRITIIYK